MALVMYQVFFMMLVTMLNLDSPEVYSGSTVGWATMNLEMFKTMSDKVQTRIISTINS